MRKSTFIALMIADVVGVCICYLVKIPYWVGLIMLLAICYIYCFRDNVKDVTDARRSNKALHDKLEKLKNGEPIEADLEDRMRHPERLPDQWLRHAQEALSYAIITGDKAAQDAISAKINEHLGPGYKNNPLH